MIRGIGPLSHHRWLGLLALPASLALVAAALLGMPDRRQIRLAEVSRWTYQLQGLEASMEALAQSPSDMLVVDYAKAGERGMVPLSREEVARLKQRPDGRSRLVIAYFSIGEAEEYRPYWQADWRGNPPKWLLGENCRWPGNFLVAFWEASWRRIVFEGPDSYLARIQQAGFDGVYLDRIDVYGDLASRFPGSRDRMVGFVADLAATARGGDRRFLVIAQNAEELLGQAAYRRSIDAVAKEDLLFGVGATGVRNAPEMIDASIELLGKLKADGKPVFAIEYLRRQSDIEATAGELSGKGIVAVFPPRALDGSDPVNAGTPVAPEAAQSDMPKSDDAAEYGTPEYAEKHCNGVWPKADDSSLP